MSALHQVVLENTFIQSLLWSSDDSIAFELTVEAGVRKLDIRAIGDGSGDIKSDGSVNFTGRESFEDGLTSNNLYNGNDNPFLRSEDFVFSFGDIDVGQNGTYVTVHDDTQKFIVAAIGGVTMSHLAGAGSGFVAVDNSGNLTWAAAPGGGLNPDGSDVGATDEVQVFTEGMQGILYAENMTDSEMNTFEATALPGTLIYNSDQSRFFGLMPDVFNKLAVISDVQNMATHDLTFTGNRVHDMDDLQMEFHNAERFSIYTGAGGAPALDVNKSAHITQILANDGASHYATIRATGTSGSEDAIMQVGNGVVTNFVDVAITGISMAATHINLTLTNYANNAAALAGGLISGDLYRTSGAVMIVT